MLLYFKCAIRVLSLHLIVILSYCIHELVLNPSKTCEMNFFLISSANKQHSVKFELPGTMLIPNSSI